MAMSRSKRLIALSESVVKRKKQIADVELQTTDVVELVKKMINDFTDLELETMDSLIWPRLFGEDAEYIDEEDDDDNQNGMYDY